MAGANSAQDEPPDGGYFGIDIPFMAHLGVRAERLGPDGARTRLALRPELANSRGHLHGGVLLALLDFTLSCPARADDPTGIGVATVELSTQFLAPVTTDVVCEARLRRAGGSLAFCEGEVRDNAGVVVASATAVYKRLRK